MIVMHLLTSGGVGGIEILCRDIGLYSSKTDHVFVFLFGEGKIFEKMKRSGLRVVSLSEYKKLSFNRFRKLYELTKESDVVIVHHNDPFLEMYYLLLKITCPQKKYISMIHHCYDPLEEKEEYGLLKRTIKKVILKNIIRYSDRLIFVSKAGLDSFRRYFRIAESKTEVVYNGISENKILNGKKFIKEKKEIPVILYAGRLEKIKGVDLLLHAMHHLPDLKCRVLIVGDGKQKKNLMELCEKLELSDRIQFLGFQEDIEPLLADADIFVYPSRMEIFGISVVEALAFQCICVVNNVGGMPEIIQNDVNGIVNLDNTVDGLAASIVHAIEIYQGNNRINMMDMAQKSAERFSIMQTITQIEHILGEF